MSVSVANNFTSAISLAGTGAVFSVANNYAVAPLSFFNQISICGDTANCSLRLPVNPILSQEYRIKNDGSVPALIFPGNTASQIDSLGAGAAFRLAANAQCVLIASSNDGA